jgi:ATP-binding cassette subfamily B protein
MSGRESIDSLSEIMQAEDMESAGGKTVLPAIDGRVDFEKVSYRYPDGDKYVIKDFTLHVKTGECIAVVGSSGSGKSTIINLLIGLLDPTEGKVLIDGVPLSEMSKQTYRHFISVVPQNSILFSGTIRENITYGLDYYSENRLNSAVNDADIPEFLPSLPNGLDSQVGEHGDKLSGGQKQRVCIARALIRDPRILIMDEATSALDNVSEYHVQKAVNRLVKARTTFIVAHRLSTIRNADRIVVMENGVAVEIGTYDELMKLNGKFSELERLSRIREDEAQKGSE